MMIRTSLFGLFALFALCAFGAARDSAPAEKSPPVLVELFTSQGCSSCPPADRVLELVARRADTLALSFHITYWDDLGWKDPFSAPAHTERQKAYRLTFHNDQIYTPQMVIGGLTEMVGQDARMVTAAIGRVAQSRPAGPGLTLRRDGKVTLSVDAAAGIPAATVWLAAYAPHAETAVRRGENSGKMLASTNVVRRLVALGPYSGSAADFTAPADFARDDEGVAAWVQANPTGVIFGAANAPPGSR
jgi:hypothetical protein